MLYIYREFDDPVGEGTRAALHEYSDQRVAHAAFNEFAAQTDTTYMKMIVGTEQREYTAGKAAEEARTLSDDELQKSALEDVDDLQDKEGV